MDINDMLDYFKQKVGELEYIIAYKTAENKGLAKEVEQLKRQIEASRSEEKGEDM